jgi:transcriptional regulator with XRE-family HTH domain
MSNRVTNQSVADVLNVDQSYVSLIRHGHRMPSRHVAARIKASYSVDPSTFLAAYMSNDPQVFAKYFNALVGFPVEQEVTSD